MKTIKTDGFEGGFYDWQDVSELTIPKEWGIAWAEGDYSRPEADEKFGKPERHKVDGEFTGNNALSIQTTNGHKHKCVLFRQFEVEPNKLYRPSIWAMGLTHTGGDSGAGMRIGMDTQGRLDWESPGVKEGRKWSQWYDQYHKEADDPLPWVDGEWVNLSVVARAENDTITVFIWTSCDYKAGAMAHFDDFLLEVEGDDTQPPPQPPDGEVVVQLTRIADYLERIEVKL